MSVNLVTNPSIDLSDQSMIYLFAYSSKYYEESSEEEEEEDQNDADDDADQADSKKPGNNNCQTLSFLSTKIHAVVV